MGVRGLETFMHGHPECIKLVNMEDMARDHRKKYKSIPKLMIDSSTCLHFLMNKKPWISGYQLKVMADVLEMLLKRIKSIGIEVTCFLGGLVHPDKFDHWVRNQMEKIDVVNKIFNMIRSNQLEVPKIEYHKMYSNDVRKVIIDCFKKYECQIFQSTIGSHEEAAMYARKHHYFGILAQNSDFVIHNCAEYYFSMKHLDLETLNTVCYRADTLAVILDLSPKQLPMLATAMGNSVVYSGLLKEFHKSLFIENEKVTSRATFFKVANFIKENVKTNQSLNSQLPALSKTIFQTANKSYCIRNSLKSYNIFSQDENVIDDLDDPKWHEFLKLTLQLHKEARLPPIVYQIVSQSTYFHRVIIADPSKQYNQIWFEIEEQLRRKIYGIILVNSPQARGKSGSIKEIYIDANKNKHENYVEPIYPEMEIDLLKLWLDEDGIYVDDKWNLFCSTLKIERHALPVEDIIHILIPVATLKHLLMEHFEMATWELEAVLASVLLLQYYSVEDIEAIPEFPLDPDGVHLYWYLMKIFDLVTVLNSVCGYPLDFDFASPIHYQDGKLFHHKYRQAKENKSFKNLCEFRRREIRMGKKILAIICD